MPTTTCSDSLDERVAHLEAQAERAQARIGQLEQAVGQRSSVRARPVARELEIPMAPPARKAPVGPARPSPTATEPRHATELSEPIGASVLAWVGGLAVLAGVLFFLAMAISQGWIGPGARVLLAGTGSLGLLAAGVWLHDRRGRTEAAVMAAASAIASLYATIAVATRVYGLVDAAPGMLLALGVAGAATQLAVRWDRRTFASLGLLGTLLAPMLVGADLRSGATVVLLFVASAACAAVVVWRGWPQLALAVVVIATPQWAIYLAGAGDPAAGLLVLGGFGLLGAVAAVGPDLRAPALRLRGSSVALLALNTCLIAAIGYAFFASRAGAGAAEGWLWTLAAVHLGAATWRRLSSPVRLTLGALGVVLADVAFGVTVHGTTLVLGWAVVAVAFAAAVRRHPLRENLDRAVLGGGVGVHLALVLLQALLLAPPTVLLGGDASASGAIAVAVLAAACLCAGWLVGAERGRIALYATAMTAIGYLTAATLSGPALVGAWAAEGLALSRLGRSDAGAPVASVGGLAFLGAATLHALAVEAPPSGLIYGVSDLGAAAITLGAASLAALGSGLAYAADSRERTVLCAAAAGSLLYLASVTLISAFQPAAGQLAVTVLDLSVRQQGQVLLSVMWSVVGLAALIVALRARLRGMRIVAVAMLLVTAAKVFLYDLSTLNSVYRVTSFVVLGLLLLAGAYAHARLAPSRSRADAP